MADNTNTSKTKFLLMPVIIQTVLGLCLFLPAGSLHYWAGWTWWSVIFAMGIFITVYFTKSNPAFLARRNQSQKKDPQPGVMRILTLLFTLGFLFPGFDYRYHWSAVPAEVVIAANVIVLLGFLFIFLVFKENNYASSIIQVEQEQPVITTGPYAVVRHPMYTGILLISLFTPLALGSYWAFLFFVLAIPINVFRIRKEEALLQRDLPGYADYCRQTSYRLVPFIW